MLNRSRRVFLGILVVDFVPRPGQQLGRYTAF